MALLKDLIVQGASRFIGDAYLALVKSGTWHGSIIEKAYGGTGVDNTNITARYVFAAPTSNGAASFRALDKIDVGLNLVENTALSTWAGSSNLTTCSQGTFGTMAVANASDYLLKSGGTMTGAITLPLDNSSAFNTLDILFGTNGSSGRIGANSNGGVGIYAKEQIFLRPGSGTSTSSYGLIIASNSLTYNGYTVLNSNNSSISGNTITINGVSTTWTANGGAAASAATLSSWGAAADNDTTWRYIWMSYNDNSGRACYDPLIAYRTSDDTLKVPNLLLSGSVTASTGEIDSLTAGNLVVQGTSSVGTVTSGTWNGDRLTALYIPTDVVYTGATQTLTNKTISTGSTYQGTVIADDYIESAAAWNAAYGWYTLMTDTTNDTDTKLNRWQEVVTFLDDFTEADTLANVLSRFVTLNTPQTISGNKTFTGATTFSQAIDADLLGTATQANRLSNAMTLELTGSVTGSVSFDGSGKATLNTTTNHTHAYVPTSQTISIAGTNVNVNGGSISAATIGAALTSSAPAAYATNAGNSDTVDNLHSSNFTRRAVYTLSAGSKVVVTGSGPCIGFSRRTNSKASKIWSYTGYGNASSRNSIVILDNSDTNITLMFFDHFGFVIENNADNNADITLMCQATPTFTTYAEATHGNLSTSSILTVSYDGHSHAWSSLTGTAPNVSTFTNDANYIKASNYDSIITSLNLSTLDVSGQANFSSGITGNLNGNASTATLLQNARTITIKDNDNTNTGTSIPFNGGSNIILNLPSTIKASITGNATTATTAGALSSTIANDKLPTRLQQYITSDYQTTGNGFGRMTSASPFTPLHTSAADCMLIQTGYSDIWAAQIALDYRSNGMFIRNKNNGTWNTWNEVVTVLNDQTITGNKHFSTAEVDSLTAGNLVVQGITSGTLSNSLSITMGSTTTTYNNSESKSIIITPAAIGAATAAQANVSTPQEAIALTATNYNLSSASWTSASNLTGYSGTFVIQITDTNSTTQKTNYYSGVITINGATGRQAVEEIPLSALMATGSDTEVPTRIYAGIQQGFLKLSSQDSSEVAHNITVKILKLIAL